MIRAFRNYKPSGAAGLVDKFNLILYLEGFPNFWIEPLNLSQKFIKIYNVISFFLHIITVMFSFFLSSSFIFQKNLSVKQKADQSVCNLANPFSNFYCFVFLYHRKRCREVLYTLMVVLKQEYNDPVVEKRIVITLKAYIIAYFGGGLVALTFYAFFGILQVAEGHPFITIVPGWPDIRDVSTTAEVTRVMSYLFLWISFIRISGCYLLLLSLLIGISHQYKNLGSYFFRLNSIFEDDLSQEEKEIKYEKAFTRGVQMHSQTKWCMNETQYICRVVFDAQMMLATIASISLRPVILASKLAEAMYGSGWQNCKRQSSVRVRKLVVIAMTQAQQPVVLKALVLINLSYESYLTVIKTSHSVFSVLN